MNQPSSIQNPPRLSFPVLVELVGEAIRMGHSPRVRAWCTAAQRLAATASSAPADAEASEAAKSVHVAFLLAEALVNELGAVGRATLATHRR